MAKATRNTTSQHRKASARSTVSLPATAVSWGRWVSLCMLLAILIISTMGYLQHRHNATTTPATTVGSAQRIKPTFDFYDLLPKIEVPVSSSAPTAKRPVPTPPATLTQPTSQTPITAATTGDYILQAGSFKQRSDADALSAKLALLGFDVQVKRFQAGNQQDWYRVLAGPYSSERQARQAQAQLQHQQIDSLLRKAG